MKQTVIFLLLIFCPRLNGQENIDPTTFDYSEVDSIAVNFPKDRFKSYNEFISPLTENLETDHEKFRVLFRWITENISYSYRNKSNKVDRAVKTKRAVCIGYSMLLKEMCNSVGIECEVISGYAKTEVSDIGTMDKKTLHAWNAVNLYDKWYLVDVTWASGYYNDKKRTFEKTYKELYYLTPPEIFIRKHYPKNKKWQLLETPISRNEFIKSPIYYIGFFENHISDLYPQKGHIKIRLKDTLEIKFKTDCEIERATIALDVNKFVYRPEINSTDDNYFVSQKFEKPGIYDLNFFLNGVIIVAYRLEVLE